MRIKPFQAVYPNFNYIASPDSFFSNVKYDYPEYKRNGFFNKTAQEAIYIYRIQGPERSYTGLIACADINDYLEGHIKQHEDTLRDKEQQQMHLMIRRNAIVKPVLLTYYGVPEINELIAEYTAVYEPFYETEFSAEQCTHTFWEVHQGVAIQAFQNLFRTKVPHTYIADGHHRSSTVALMHERQKAHRGDDKFGLLLSAFFPMDELEVHDYNRVVEGLSDCSMTTFMAKLSHIFEIEILDGPARPSKKHDIVLFINREWFLLHWKAEVLKQHSHEDIVLDASLLDQRVLKDILGIADVRTDQRVKYVEGPKGLEEIRARSIKNENRVAFILYPVALSELIEVSDAGKSMPPKSTWFEPRIKNGLIVQEL